MMYGQIRIEFVFGMIIFAMIIFFITSQLNTILSTTLSDARINDLKAKAVNVLTLLVEDKGDPPNWHLSEIIKRIGLAANQPYNISKEKVNKLSQNCDLLNYFDIETYRLKIYNLTNLILFCGTESLKPATIIVYRSIFIDTGFGNITLELW